MTQERQSKEDIHEDDAEHLECGIAVVGAGLVGSLLAIFLAKRGFEVDVFERRQDMRQVEISAGRSINLNMSRRGIEALERVGIADQVLAEVVPMMGRMMHSREGKLTYQPYGKDDTEYGNSVSRGGLNKILMNRAEETGKVKFHFNMKAESIDFERNIIRFTGADGKTICAHASLIMGTDGGGSAVREEMMRLADYQCTIDPLDYGYKELYIPPAADGGFQLEKNALHIWPRGSFMVIALPNFDGSFTVTLFLPYKSNDDCCFDKLKDEQSVGKFFSDFFPDAVPLMPDLVENFMSNPTGHMETIRCYPWQLDGKALLLGDAAHGVVPFYGQGMNCGFEDLSVLDRLIEEHVSHGGSLYVERRLRGHKTASEHMSRRQQQFTHNWAKIFKTFVEERKENCDAIAEMAVENFIEMRDRVADPKFLLAKAVEKILEKKFPGQYVSRYSLVTFSTVPYKLAQEAGVICEEILSELVVGLEKADDVDLAKAEVLIRSKLAPILAKRTDVLQRAAT